MKKNVLIAVLLVVVGAGGALAYLKFAGKRQENEPNATEFCAKHKIAEKDCPWCDPSLIKTKGQCPGHGVPEALCSQCNPALIPGFKAENDWCAGHSIPESQCDLCKAGNLPPGEKR